MNIALSNIVDSGHCNCTREAQSPNIRSRIDPVDNKLFTEDASTMYSSPANQNENLAESKN